MPCIRPPIFGDGACVWAGPGLRVSSEHHFWICYVGDAGGCCGWERISLIKIGGYFPMELEPGRHKIGLRASIFGTAMGEVKNSITFSVLPGEVK